MNEHDETLDGLEGKMATWHQWWDINGDHVQCIDCRACQWPWNAAQPFEHEPGCRIAASAPSHPWQDLATILRR